MLLSRVHRQAYFRRPTSFIVPCSCKVSLGRHKCPCFYRDLLNRISRQSTRENTAKDLYTYKTRPRRTRTSCVYLYADQSSLHVTHSPGRAYRQNLQPVKMKRSSVRVALSVTPAIFFYYTVVDLCQPGQQQLLYDKICFQEYPSAFNGQLCTGNDKTFIDAHKDIQKAVARWTIYSWLCEYLIGIPVTLYTGLYCDFVGRKAPIICVIAFKCLAYGTTMLQAYYVEWPIVWMLIPNILSGLGGGSMALFVPILSMLSHSSSKKSMSKLFILAECFLPMGVLVAKFSSGYIIQYWGVLVLYAIATGGMLLNLVLSSLLVSNEKANLVKENSHEVDESHYTVNYSADDEDDRPNTPVPGKAKRQRTVANHHSRWWQLLHVKYIKETILLLVNRSSRTESSMVWILLFSLVTLTFGETGCSDIFYLYYTKELGYQEAQYGIFNAVKYGSALVGTTVGSWVFLKLLKLTDLSVIFMTFVTGVPSLYFYGLANIFPPSLWISAGLFAFYIPGKSCIRSFLTKKADKDNFGKMLSIVYSVDGIARLCSILAYNSVYSLSLSFFPGLCFYIGASVCCLGMCACAVMGFLDTQT